MRQLFALALVLTLVAVPACAQRGGARGGGFAGARGGFAGSRGGFAGRGQYRYARPGFYNRGRADRRERRFGVPYVYPGWLDSGYLWDPDYDDFSGYDDGSVNGPADGSGAQRENYVEEPSAEYQPVPDEAAQQGATVPPAQTAAPTLYDSGAVTLVFKDGRPPETIHNYALTRTTLYVTDAHHREIPVAELDLAATEKANRDAGISFQLPHAQK